MHQKLSLFILFALSIIMLPSCADYEDYTYTTSTDPSEAIEAMPERLKLFSEGYFGIYSDLIPVSVLWDVDTEMHNWEERAEVGDIGTDTFEGFVSLKMKGTNTSWFGIGIIVKPDNPANYNDMSIYSNGHFNFAYKGTKNFKVGMSSGTTSATDDVWFFSDVTLSNFGLKLDGNWCEISIPMTNLIADKVTFDITGIRQYFMFAADAGLGYTVGDVHYIDNVHYTKD
ncbi:MAG: hypothetical protein KAS64_06340 [Spirochaetes bacterium]|nr:hypothetical protein [Spirochaetota bacterium]